MTCVYNLNNDFSFSFINFFKSIFYLNFFILFKTEKTKKRMSSGVLDKFQICKAGLYKS